MVKYFVGGFFVLVVGILLLQKATIAPKVSDMPEIVWVPITDVHDSDFIFTKKGEHIYVADHPDNQTLPGSLFSDADPSTFVIALDEKGKRTLYAKDKTHVYWFDIVEKPGGLHAAVFLIPGANPVTFQPLDIGFGSGGFYSKDQKQVFWVDSPIVGADAPTFTVVRQTSTYDAQDKNHIYIAGHMVN